MTFLPFYCVMLPMPTMLAFKKSASSGPLWRGLLLVSLAGCGGPYKEPTIDEFDGKLIRNGQPISFEATEKPVLRLVFHKNGERFGVPIQSDGTFDIGWMPIGQYSAMLERRASGSGRTSAGLRTYNLPDGLTISDGQQRYVIELGDKFDP